MVLTKWLNSKLETKFIYTSPVQASILAGTLTQDIKFNQSISSAADCYMLMPPIQQGVGVNNRIGQDIMPLSFKLQLCMSLVLGSNEVNSLSDSANSGPEDITVHVFMLRSKVYPDSTQQLSLNVGADLMCTFNGQNEQQFDGNYWSSRLMVNREKYHVLHHKAIRLRKATGYQSYVRQASSEGLVEPTDAVATPATPGAQMAQFTLDIPCPKRLTYSTAFTQQPENYAPFICIGWVANEYPVASPLVRAYYPLAVTARTMFKYKDA